MTQQEAERLAKMERSYVAKQSKRTGLWYVWDKKSDHVVEF